MSGERNGKKVIRFGVIGCGLMGKEFASAAARWCHLSGVDFEPRIVAVCDANAAATQWFTDNVASVRQAYTDYKELLADTEVDAVYCAVPHNLHAQIYVDIIRAGKHLLGEKPFGIDREANRIIVEEIRKHPNVIVRCSSEFPFFPGAYRIAEWVRSGKFGRIIEVEAGFWHSSDLDPRKPINWKRRIATNGEYGCMGDLGMHVMHLPLRFGWRPKSVRALLNKVVSERPDASGTMVPCETWDNAILACDVETDGQSFPMVLSTKRIAPGHANTWFIRIQGTDFSAEFSTKNPKQVTSMPYTPGGEQAWHVEDVAYKSAYGTITGGIFEFGFSDSILQMWAAFCDELANGAAEAATVSAGAGRSVSDGAGGTGGGASANFGEGVSGEGASAKAGEGVNAKAGEGVNGEGASAKAGEGVSGEGASVNFGEGVSAKGVVKRQPLYCATPDEAADSHIVFTAALESQRTGQTVVINWGD